MGKTVPMTVELGVAQEELFAIYATGTGVTGNASEVSTQYQSVLKSLMTPTKSMTGLMQEMGVEDGKAMIAKYGLGESIKKIVEHSKESKAPLSDYIGSVNGQVIALALAGEQSDVYADKLEQLYNSTGSMTTAFESQTDGINATGFSFQQSMIKMQVAGQKMGDALGPMLSKGADLLSDLASKLGNLSSEQMESIAKWGTMAIVSGGALKVLGGGISTIGSITTRIGALTGKIGVAQVATTGIGTAAATAGGVGGLGALGAGLGGAVVAAAPFLVATAGVVAVGVGIKKAMEKEAVPAVDLFANKVETTATSVENSYEMMDQAYETTVTKISESTQEAVGSYLELDESAKKHIDSIYINSTQVTEEMKNELIGIYDEMGTTINTETEEKRRENIADLEDFFQNSKSITESEQKDLLEATNKYYEDKKKDTDESEQKIKDIIQKASDEKRELTNQERLTINKIQDEMKTEAIKILSDNEIEAKVILERMKEYDGRITAEQAAEHIKTLNESRDKSKVIAEDEYEKRIATLIKMKDEAKVISKDQADKLIEDAKRQRDETIDAAKKTREGAVSKMKLMNRDLEKEVDTTTGEILTRWDKLKNWWKKWIPEKKTFETKHVERTVKKSSGGGGGISTNWRGNESFEGGLTTLHEKGYEVYDLPRGTRIYNNEASEEMVLKTAEAVAKRMVVDNSGSKGVNVTQNIYSPSPSPSEIARQTKNSLREMALGL